MASIDLKVSNHIPNDLLFSILSKLPLKSIHRFTCVRKSWDLLFQNTDFMSAVRKHFLSKYHSYYNDTCILLKQTIPNYEYHCTIYMLSGERFQNKVKLELPLPFQDDDTYINISGSGINGILCLYQGEDHRTIVLWKPTTNEFKVIPPSHVFSLPYVMTLTMIHGFGYDSISNDYKLIRHAQLFQSNDFDASDNIWEIYSLRSNSWKKLDVDMPCRDVESVDVYMNGMCHWWGQTSDEEYVISFDLSDEVFLKTPIPLEMYDSQESEWVERHLAVLNMSIALISNYANNASFHISILCEIGVMESWTKLFIVGPLIGVEHPIGVGKNGDIFFRKENDELTYFNLITGVVEDVGIQGESLRCQMVIFKEYLLPMEE
ncbi:F-box/kelch-repeat protein At3g06240-like [Cicer arietinum]|uniref:F-box/kelch-repeat protein At3g06240-like n=1 Tax=Cicer arietinum TaxID=3827 RepID=A0A1S2YU91_CICAR|nr:F-box/kelch-repeat protein At3g06240-like [Cicer arietinum]